MTSQTGNSFSSGAVLSGKTALVTGASKGIGRAIALAFGEAGANVVATARTESEIESVASAVEGFGSRSLGVIADLGVEADVDRLAAAAEAEFGGVDILVNNAAIIHGRIPVVDFDRQLWRDVMDVNITGAFLLTQALLPGMIARGSGKVINISSIGGRKGGYGRSAYRISKTAMISFTESLAAEVYEHGISVNAICPGGTDTEGFRAAFNTTGRAESPRLMESSEIADVAMFLATDASSAVTGTAIDSFGGSNPLFS
jgi:NAD(P)-dependent dehydrogenase (short-subunit alcohol dehydrogenase family)